MKEKIRKILINMLPCNNNGEDDILSNVCEYLSTDTLCSHIECDECPFDSEKNLNEAIDSLKADEVPK